MYRYRICRNERPGRLIFSSNNKNVQNQPKAIGFVYSSPPPFEKALFLVGAYLRVGIYFGKYGMFIFRLY